MTITLADIKHGVRLAPPLTVIYGTHGVGKTSFAASAPAPIFIQTEDGMGLIDMPTFGVMTTFTDVVDALRVLLTEEHPYQTGVIDSLDHLEPMVWAQVCKDNNWPNIEHPGFGKGYVAALDAWRFLFDLMRQLRDQRSIGVVCIAHTQISRFDSPDQEPYDRYSPKLAKATSALVQEIADTVLFANYRVATTSTDVGFKKKVTRGVGGGDRVLYAEERPAFLAKNRYSMPAAIPMTWADYAQYVPFYATQTQKE